MLAAYYFGDMETAYIRRIRRRLAAEYMHDGAKFRRSRRRLLVRVSARE